MELAITIFAALAGFGGAGWALWAEKQPIDPLKPRLMPTGVVGIRRGGQQPIDPLKPRLMPTTPVLFICLVIVIFAAAHLLTLITGRPHVGRFGI